MSLEAFRQPTSFDIDLSVCGNRECGLKKVIQLQQNGQTGDRIMGKLLPQRFQASFNVARSQFAM
jgi:hypothetical protein